MTSVVTMSAPFHVLGLEGGSLRYSRKLIVIIVSEPAES